MEFWKCFIYSTFFFSYIFLHQNCERNTAYLYILLKEMDSMLIKKKDE